MYFLNLLLVIFVKTLARIEMPAWGYLHEKLVKRFVSENFWIRMGPRVIRDKKTNLLWLLDPTEWADRLFFFLGRWYDLETQLAMELILEEGDNIADVGANYGNFALTACTLIGEKGCVVAFEPNPYAFSRLRTNIDMNRLQQIEAVNAGLSDEAGTLTLNVPGHNAGEASFANKEFSDFKVFNCQIITGDERFSNLKLACIKIDVEGFEVRVLRGFEKVIKRDHPWIITEVVKAHLQRDGHVPEDLADILLPHEYTPFRIIVVGKGPWKKLSLLRSDIATEVESDILWVPEHRLGGLQASGVTVN